VRTQASTPVPLCEALGQSTLLAADGVMQAWPAIFASSGWREHETTPRPGWRDLASRLCRGAGCRFAVDGRSAPDLEDGNNSPTLPTIVSSAIERPRDAISPPEFGNIHSASTTPKCSRISQFEMTAPGRTPRVYGATEKNLAHILAYHAVVASRQLQQSGSASSIRPRIKAA
jgi:hypothetical protein